MQGMHVLSLTPAMFVAALLAGPSVLSRWPASRAEDPLPTRAAPENSLWHAASVDGAQAERASRNWLEQLLEKDDVRCLGPRLARGAER